MVESGDWWRDRTLKIVRAHEGWRSRTLNLIASENVMSPIARRSLTSDLLGRYADYDGRDLASRRYRGTRFVTELEEAATALAGEVFATDYVELRPIAGHLAGAAVLMAVCGPGDTVMEVGREGGSHREATKVAGTRLSALDVQYLPFDGLRYNVDRDAAAEAVRKARPKLVILGSSNFLFPHPVHEIAEAVHETGGYLAYDGSHVMGFLAAGRFQDPLREGADVVFGSTHKTLPGPQGGIVFSNNDLLMDRVAAALYPTLITNHHTFRIPALMITLAEMRIWGREYVDQIVSNAEALADALEGSGVPVLRVEGLHTNSHTILVKVASFGDADTAARRLEASGIIAGGTRLPVEHGEDGVRMGLQEVTRLGAAADDMAEIAQLISDALSERRSSVRIARDAANVAARFRRVRYTW